jgi:hypothetical protein
MLEINSILSSLLFHDLVLVRLSHHILFTPGIIFILAKDFVDRIFLFDSIQASLSITTFVVFNIILIIVSKITKYTFTTAFCIQIILKIAEF